ncbi:isochorismate synthase [Wenyingzhuangia heitensis]|uniref:isochorismate synthase n=1 Tax=Wenyingzhuangia heitensis TaxID=1487859 RepID=A0ABX0UG10_9FLAO|nr:isochorismate synthase [Wenyingzhuangia heitensis]NIJ46126.1 isochorismate synthase [Wenyingzhuangia heitensis]
MNILEKIKIAEQEGTPFVAYKSPNVSDLTFIGQNTDELYLFTDFSDSGYVFAPFDNNEDAYILKPDIVCVQKIESTPVFKDKVDLNSNVDENTQISHQQKVTAAVNTIKTTGLSKIVISRKEDLLIDDFDTIRIFNNLLNSYINAYVYLWYHPKVGMWMGATPETLLNVEKGFFKTMSLAGTQAYKGDLHPKWGAKELEEQQMVSDFIKQNLKNTVNDLCFSEVKTVKAGTLLHLKTKVTGALKKDKDLEKIIKLLHPTPAVCGLPKEDSKTYILENEGYHRSFYTGYLGVLNMNKKTSLFVNLRCFSIKNNKVCLYVGGGITKDSNPEKEWLETVAKSKTIKNVLI